MVEDQSARKPCVLIVGLKASEVQLLERNVGASVHLNLVSSDKVLRMRGGDPQFVVVTRFVNHKHTMHLRRIMGGDRVRFVGRGGATTVAKAIQSFLDKVA
jgi:hypothetical protein